MGGLPTTEGTPRRRHWSPPPARPSCSYDARDASTALATGPVPTRATLVGFPVYFARRGRPAHPRDLLEHDCLSAHAHQRRRRSLEVRRERQGPRDRGRWTRRDQRRRDLGRGRGRGKRPGTRPTSSKVTGPASPTSASAAPRRSNDDARSGQQPPPHRRRTEAALPGSIS